MAQGYKKHSFDSKYFEECPEVRLRESIALSKDWEEYVPNGTKKVILAVDGINRIRLNYFST